MSLVQKKDIYHNSNYQFFEESSSILARAENTLKTKREQVEQAKYELELTEMDVLSKYKQHVSYDFTFNPSILEKAWTWYCMINKNKDKEGNPIDKRKKYEEKERFNWVLDELERQFGKKDIKITDILQFAYGIAYEIMFTTSGYSFQLTVPVVQNVQLREYLNYGPEIFKLKLYWERIESCFDCIGSTFEENELKDILDDWLAKQEEKE